MKKKLVALVLVGAAVVGLSALPASAAKARPAHPPVRTVLTDGTPYNTFR